MSMSKVAVTVDEDVLRKVDAWVAAGQFPNRSRAFQAGLQLLADELAQQGRLLRELSKLDPAEERSFADEQFVGDAVWPRY